MRSWIASFSRLFTTALARRYWRCMPYGIVVDLGPALRYSLEVTWIPTVIGGLNRGSDRMGYARKPDRVQR